MIQLYHVCKEYERDLQALQDVNLRIDKGEFIFVTGPSGAGKTTLLKLLFAAEQPTSGQIIVGGRNVSRLSAKSIPSLRRSIGVVFQDFKLINHWTVLRNVAFVLEIMGLPAKKIKRKAWLTLKMVHLQHKMDTYPQKLSGGEQQRVAIARALVNDPLLLLADEPTGNLDPEMSMEIMKLFVDINMRGTTLILASHDKALIEQMNKRVVILEKGRLVSTGGDSSGPFFVEQWR